LTVFLQITFFETTNHFQMIFFSLCLGLLGLALSAMFSGSETAFYRISKIRLRLDAMANDRTAVRLLRFVNHPSIFVATILVGNNVANYVIAMTTVMLISELLPNSQGIIVEIGSTFLLAPLLFVYGEMFPKYLCLRAPNRMLRILSPFIGFFYQLFLPLTTLLWLLNTATAHLLGKSPQLLQLTLGRQELARVLDEGQETGILFDTQRRLADGVFDISTRQVKDWAVPQVFLPVITTKMKPAEVLNMAQQHHLVEMPVYEQLYDDDDFAEDIAKKIPIGYVRTIDLEITVRNQLDEQARQLLQLLHTELPIRSTVEISSRHTLLTGMILMQTLQGSFGCVIDEHRRCIGFVQSDQLRNVLLGKNRP
jgi:CBS domain containing-hemolysin-like protein